MLSAVDVAKYFLSKDTDRRLFNKNLINRNGRTFYEGNARLNKYLHAAQNLYIAKTGNKLFEDDLFAFDNGAVALSVQQNYSVLLALNVIPVIEESIRIFLDKVYKAFEHATLDELIEISHEDQEWRDKNPQRESQCMDSLAYAADYKNQYKDMLKVMDRMEV